MDKPNTEISLSSILIVTIDFLVSIFPIIFLLIPEEFADFCVFKSYIYH